MASQSAYDTIKGLLQSRFGASIPIVDIDQVEPHLAQDECVFFALESLPGQEMITGIGDPDNLCIREFGAVNVHGFFPAPHASNQARGTMDDVRTAIRLFRDGDLYIDSLSTPEFGIINEGIWTAAAITVSYQLNFHAAAQVA